MDGMVTSAIVSLASVVISGLFSWFTSLRSKNNLLKDLEIRREVAEAYGECELLAAIDAEIRMRVRRIYRDRADRSFVAVAVGVALAFMLGVASSIPIDDEFMKHVVSMAVAFSVSSASFAISNRMLFSERPGDGKPDSGQGDRKDSI